MGDSIASRTDLGMSTVGRRERKALSPAVNVDVNAARASIMNKSALGNKEDTPDDHERELRPAC